MKIIVGLGNPGKEFEDTRHNTGFLALDKLKSQIINKSNPPAGGPNFQFQKKFKAEILKLDAKRYFLDADLLLVKPQTFMNSSGQAVAKIIKFYKVKLKDLYLIHDDLDIELGEYKIQFAKGPRQHNGVLSVEKELETKDFWRARLGIKNKEKPAYALETSHRLIQPRSVRGASAGENYVLEKFSKEERAILEGLIDKVIRELIGKVL